MLTFFLKIDVGGGLNCAKVYANDLFCRSTVHSAKFGQIHAAVTIMAADDHVPQFPEESARTIFWPIIAEIDVLLFFTSACILAPWVRH